MGGIPAYFFFNPVSFQPGEGSANLQTWVVRAFTREGALRRAKRDTWGTQA